MSDFVVKPTDLLFVYRNGDPLNTQYKITVQDLFALPDAEDLYVLISRGGKDYKALLSSFRDGSNTFKPFDFWAIERDGVMYRHELESIPSADFTINLKVDTSVGAMDESKPALQITWEGADVSNTGTPAKLIKPNGEEHFFTTEGELKIAIGGAVDGFYKVVGTFKKLWFRHSQALTELTVLPKAFESMITEARGKYLFANCPYISYVSEGLRPLAAGGMFYEATFMSVGPQIATWDWGDVKDWNQCFQGCQDFTGPVCNEVIDFRTTQQTFSYMFRRCVSYNALLSDFAKATPLTTAYMFSQTSYNLPINLDLSMCRYLSGMFQENPAFNNDSVVNWDTSYVMNFKQVFDRATSFNQDIGRWNTALGDRMDEMFSGAVVFNQNLSYWCVTNIPNKPDGWTTALVPSLPEEFYPDWGKCPESRPKIVITQDLVDQNLELGADPVTFEIAAEVQDA